MRRLASILGLIASLSIEAPAHDIPNQRVDRSIQGTLSLGRLAIDYEVSLSELTLTQDLRSLIGELPGGDRREWFDRYGRETGPLNAKGLLVALDGHPLDLRDRGFDLAVEEHPRYIFHYEAAVASRGRLSIHDTNFSASEGTSRLGLRGRDGVLIRGDLLPAEVSLIPPRPLWQLSDAEEKRTTQVEVDYQFTTVAEPRPAVSIPSLPSSRRPRLSSRVERLSALLDRPSDSTLLGLALLAFGLGAAHAIQPGHGKTLVAASAVGERGSWLRGAGLALVIALTHTGVVLLIAAGLWQTRALRYGDIHVGLARASGFVIAAVGLWRLGRHLAGYGEHQEMIEFDAPGARSVLSLGVAGGLVPCWDAVGLVVLADALGRLGLGLLLLVAFGLGMALILVVVSLAATRLRQFLSGREQNQSWERRLGLASGSLLTLIGLYLLC